MSKTVQIRDYQYLDATVLTLKENYQGPHFMPDFLEGSTL